MHSNTLGQMKLSSIYSSKPEIFQDLRFSPGLNVVLAEIRLPENLEKDTHNLGKSTLGRLLDFCLLGGFGSDLFLYRHKDRFADFVFFLELEIGPASFLTLRRSVEENTKISFKRHNRQYQNYRDLEEQDWDHYRQPLDRSKEILDGILNLQALKPYAFRKGIGYILRSQDDYRDVFQLSAFRGGHADWKPFVAQLLGFDSSLVSAHYAKEAESDRLTETIKLVQSELVGVDTDPSKVDGLLLLKQQEANRKRELLDVFDFRPGEEDRNRQVVDELDARISRRNDRRYVLSFNKRKLEESLAEGEVLFDPARASRLFQEAGILFEGQIKRDFEQLIEFNRAITEERRQYLTQELSDVDREIGQVNQELLDLNHQRSQALSFLRDIDAFEKYRVLTDELSEIQAEVIALETQRESIRRLQELRIKQRETDSELGQLATRLDIEQRSKNESQESKYSSIRLIFSDIVDRVISQSALIAGTLNGKSHFEFTADIIGVTGDASSAGRGTSYKKLLCVAFDLTLMRAHEKEGYPKFVFHDGIFEGLDDRKKANLLEVVREYCDLGFQQIITLIDSDMPPSISNQHVFSEDEIVLTLHDEGEDGLLFKMPTW